MFINQALMRADDMGMTQAEADDALRELDNLLWIVNRGERRLKQDA